MRRCRAAGAAAAGGAGRHLSTRALPPLLPKLPRRQAARTQWPVVGAPVRPQSNWTLFASVNATLLAINGIGVGTHPQDVASLALYVQVLGLLCTLPLCWTASVRGPTSLLLLLEGILFVHFGLRDVVLMLTGAPVPLRPETLFSGGEIAALLSALGVLLGGALVTVFARGRRYPVLAAEWSHGAMRWLAIICWSVGFGINADHLFTVADLQAGVVETSPLAGVVSLLRFLQPIGSALLVYLVVARRDRAMLLVLLGSFAADIVLGFLGDSKESAFRGVFLLLIGHLLLRDRIPVLRGAIVVLLAGASFSYFAAYRDTLASSATTRVDAVAELDRILPGIASGMSVGERVLNGLDYFSERTSLKGNLDLIVAQAGHTVAFQEGRTLIGVLYTFLPRYLFPDKPDTSTGRLFNAEFRVGAVATTYISHGINGELYWNFGWTGLVAGMVAVGALLALISHLLDPGVRANAPRFLFLIVTAYLLCVRFEGNVATEYTYWLRALVLLVLLHGVMPKRLSQAGAGAGATACRPRRRAAVRPRLLAPLRSRAAS